jgi:hypothetical protein
MIEPADWELEIERRAYASPSARLGYIPPIPHER